jgi:hypothetical protein
MGTYNSTGQHYHGHFSIWITNQLQELQVSLQDMFVNPAPISGWVNGNLYVPTTEEIGILPIPEEIRTTSGMAGYVPTMDGDQQHWFLAAKQGTRKPVLPVHTPAEKELFRELMNHDSSFSPQSGEPRWRDAVKIWNVNADRKDNISYKVHLFLFSSVNPEHTLIFSLSNNSKSITQNGRYSYMSKRQCRCQQVHENRSLSSFMIHGTRRRLLLSRFSE